MLKKSVRRTIAFEDLQNEYYLFKERGFHEIISKYLGSMSSLDPSRWVNIYRKYYSESMLIF